MDFGDVLKTLAMVPVSIGKQIASDPLGFVTNELLGFDDFGRAAKYGSRGDFLKMLKSLGAGVFEAGSTLIPAGQLLKGTKIAPFLAKGAEIGLAADGLQIPKMVSAALPTTRKILGRELPAISTKILSRIPGMTEIVAADLATQAPLRGLTTGGRRALQGFRGVEGLQLLDMGNALTEGVAGRSIPIGTARGIASEAATAAELARRDRSRAALDALLNGGVSTMPYNYMGGVYA
jgi:hypothetical protein